MSRLLLLFALSLPTLALAGDAGIGPEVTLKALVHARLRRLPAVVIGDEALLRETARRLRLRCEVVAIDEAALREGRLPPRTRGGPSSLLHRFRSEMWAAGGGNPRQQPLLVV